MAQATTTHDKPRTGAERVAYEQGLTDGKTSSEDSGIGIFSVFLACTIAILIFVDSPKQCASELAGRFDQIEAMLTGAQE